MWLIRFIARSSVSTKTTLGFDDGLPAVDVALLLGGGVLLAPDDDVHAASDTATMLDTRTARQGFIPSVSNFDVSQLFENCQNLVRKLR
jgi:hypothetical protein